MAFFGQFSAPRKALKFNGYPVQEATDELVKFERNFRTKYEIWTNEAENYLTDVYRDIKAGNNRSSSDPTPILFKLGNFLNKKLGYINYNREGKIHYDAAMGENTREQLVFLETPVEGQLERIAEERKIAEKDRYEQQQSSLPRFSGSATRQGQVMSTNASRWA